MKTTKLFMVIVGLAFSIALLLHPIIAEARSMHGAGGMRGGEFGLPTVVANLPYQKLSKEEKAGLIKMREEEKLARDVYKKLYGLWNLPIFTHIALSEQRHMDAIKSLLDKYNLSDPVVDTTVGVFTSPEMQKLYNTLVKQGSKSLIDALKVGATIEDLDIKDLQDFLRQTDNTDIKIIYQNLAKGSRNHLRAFTSQLSMNGAKYNAQYLSPAEVESIITSPQEHGMVDENGKPMPLKRGQGRKW
ncbi:DUF2202 domain-containing protein [Desulfovulcanus sp.]